MSRLEKILGRLLPIISLGVLGNLAYAWYTTDHNQFKLAHFSFGWMLVALLLALLPWFWHTLRLVIGSRFFGVEVGWKQLLRIAIATDVGGVAMPAAVGGAPLKASMLVQLGYRPGQAAMLTLWGSLEDVFFYVVAIPVSLSLTHNWDNPLWHHAGHIFQKYRMEAAAVLVGVFAVAWLSIGFANNNTRLQVWRGKIERTWSECRMAFSMILSKGRKPFFWSFLAITAQGTTRYCILLAVVRMLGFEANWTHLFLLQWMVFVAMMLTPTPGATGGAEAGFLLVFAHTLPDETVSLTMFAWRFMTYYFMLGTGAILLGVTKKKIPILYH